MLINCVARAFEGDEKSAGCTVDLEEGKIAKKKGGEVGGGKRGEKTEGEVRNASVSDIIRK